MPRWSACCGAERGAVKEWLKHEWWKDVAQDPQYDEVQVSCPEINIEQIDPVLYGKLLTEAVSAGAEFAGAKATIAGCVFDWNYDDAAQALHITCTDKPFYAGCGQVETRIRELIAKAKEAL